MAAPAPPRCGAVELWTSNLTGPIFLPPTRQGKLAEAGGLHVRALGIRRQALGEEHPDTASSLNNLAQVYDDQVRTPRHRKAEARGAVGTVWLSS